jgi:hypothetical protein
MEKLKIPGLIISMATEFTESSEAYVHIENQPDHITMKFKANYGFLYMYNNVIKKNYQTNTLYIAFTGIQYSPSHDEQRNNTRNCILINHDLGRMGYNSRVTLVASEYANIFHKRAARVYVEDQGDEITQLYCTAYPDYELPYNNIIMLNSDGSHVLQFYKIV